MEYIDMKAKYLHRLQELLNDVKRIDAKISEVDIHIGGLYHVVEKSMAGMPAIFARRERTIIVEGGMYRHRHYYYSYFLKLFLFRCSFCTTGK